MVIASDCTSLARSLALETVASDSMYLVAVALLSSVDNGPDSIMETATTIPTSATSQDSEWMILRVATSFTVFLLTAKVMISASTNITPIAIRYGVNEPITFMTSAMLICSMVCLLLDSHNQTTYRPRFPHRNQKSRNAAPHRMIFRSEDTSSCRCFNFTKIRGKSVLIFPSLSFHAHNLHATCACKTTVRAHIVLLHDCVCNNMHFSADCCKSLLILLNIVAILRKSLFLIERWMHDRGFYDDFGTLRRAASTATDARQVPWVP